MNKGKEIINEPFWMHPDNGKEIIGNNKMNGIYIKGISMPKGGTLKIEIGFDADEHPMALTENHDVFDVVLAADVLPRDEGIRIGAELAAMHGATPTEQELEKAYFDGLEYGMKRRDVRPVVRGKWKVHHKTNIAVCSCCSKPYMMGAAWHEYPPRFCPNCGADMRETE